MALTESEKIDCFRIAYAALVDVQPAVAGPALENLRLLLVDAFGEDQSRELVGQWKEEHASAGFTPESQVDCRQLATGGLAFEFVSAGMPVERARRYMRLFQYMPPMSKLSSAAECVARRQAARRSQNWARALDAGNMLVALAVLAGNAAGIFAYATENLAILKAWHAGEPDLNRDHEAEEYEWLRDHAPGMARWGGIVQTHLEMLVQ